MAEGGGFESCSRLRAFVKVYNSRFCLRAFSIVREKSDKFWQVGHEGAGSKPAFILSSFGKLVIKYRR